MTAGDPIGPELDEVFDRLLNVLDAAKQMIAVAGGTWEWDQRRVQAIEDLRKAVSRAAETRDKWRGGK